MPGSSTRSKKSGSAPRPRNSQTRKASAALEKQIVRAFVNSGLAEENAKILTATLLALLGTYDRPAVAKKAQDAAEELAETIIPADPAEVKGALNKAAKEAAAAAAAAQKGGMSPIRWNKELPGGIYTTATALMHIVALASVQAIKRVLVKAGSDSRIVNIACYMIPCLMHALPEVFAPGHIPGLSYAPYAGPAPAPEINHDKVD